MKDLFFIDLEEYIYKQVRFCRVDRVTNMSYFEESIEDLTRNFAPRAEFINTNDITFFTQIGRTNYNTNNIQKMIDYFENDYNQYRYHYMNLYIDSYEVSESRIFTHFRYITFCLWN